MDQLLQSHTENPGTFVLKVVKSTDIRILLTVFPLIRPAGINFVFGLQLRVLLEIIKFHLNKGVSGADIIRNAAIIRGRVLYEEICTLHRYFCTNGLNCQMDLINAIRKIDLQSIY